MKIPGIQ